MSDELDPLSGFDELNFEATQNVAPMGNPYDPTYKAVKARAEVRKQDEKLAKYALACWVVPLSGLLFSIAFNATVPVLGAFGGFVFIASTVIGLIISAVFLYLSFLYTGLRVHSLVGIGLGAFLSLGILFMYSAVTGYHESITNKPLIYTEEPKKEVPKKKSRKAVNSYRDMIPSK